jgi:hypothetical protein
MISSVLRAVSAARTNCMGHTEYREASRACRSWTLPSLSRPLKQMPLLAEEATRVPAQAEGVVSAIQRGLDVSQCPVMGGKHGLLALAVQPPVACGSRRVLLSHTEVKQRGPSETGLAARCLRSVCWALHRRVGEMPPRQAHEDDPPNATGPWRALLRYPT